MLAQLPFARVQQGINVALVIWLLSSLATAVWLLVPEAEQPAVIAVAPAPAAAPSREQADLAGLQALNLFGDATGASAAEEATAPADSVAEDAVKTRLDLQLVGLVKSDPASESVAVIISKGLADQYRVGDTLPVGSQVKLAKVLLDRVIIDNQGSYESLWLWDETSPVAGAATPSAAQPLRDMRSNPAITDMARGYRERLLNNPASLAEAIRIAPQTENGVMVGYRVAPGRDQQEFSALGLAEGDVITSVNGISLSDPSQALEVYKIMRSAREATFSVLRAGQNLELAVSLDDGAAE